MPRSASTSSKGYKMVHDVKPGGTFLVNCQWDAEEFTFHLPAEAKRYIARTTSTFILINAIIAQEIGMGKRAAPFFSRHSLALCKVLRGRRTSV